MKAPVARVAIGYARVSTAGQAVEGVSLEAQQAKIAAWAIAHDHELRPLFVDAISGKRQDNRPNLQKALEQVCKCKGTLIVYSLSRLARSTRDTILIGERLDKAGADLVSLSENLDTTSAAGRMLFRMLAVLAEFEREIISERTSAALQHMRSQNKRVGMIPYGWSLAADGIGLDIVPAEQAVIDRILAMRAAGKLFRQIAATLENEGIPAKNGRKWHISVIEGICKRTPLRQLKAPSAPTIP
ncbi:MAG TPA: recombinase family protein [Tepidisphaeraceae bacterium]|jgi:site-specific DNA recombinase|nr:recombinase family protein [Tepidisphaeraceae bacterium]